MNDSELKKLISNAAACLPVPWEQLWVIFQKVIQQSQDKKRITKEKQEDFNNPPYYYLDL